MRSFARIVSVIGNPLCVGLFFGVYLYFSEKESEKLRNLPLLYSLVIIIPTAVFISYNVFRKRFSDFDVSNQTQRNEVFKLLVVLSSVLTTILYFRAYPPKALLLSFILLLYVLISYGVNQKVKASIHTGMAFLFAWIFYPIDSTVALALFLFGFVNAWSRLVLSRHSLKEVVYGFIIGNSIGAVYWLIFNSFI